MGESNIKSNIEIKINKGKLLENNILELLNKKLYKETEMKIMLELYYTDKHSEDFAKEFEKSIPGVLNKNLLLN